MKRPDPDAPRPGPAEPPEAGRGPLTGVLLAGGFSRRMGRDKAWIEVDGEPLWRRQLATLAAVADEILVAVRRESASLAPEHRKVFDAPGEAGPLAGVAAALREARCERVIVLAVDLPRMTPDVLRTLAAAASPDRGTVPELDGFLLGTAAVYPRRILPRVEDALRSGDASFHQLLRPAVTDGLMRVLPVSESERPLFANWNRPGDRDETGEVPRSREDRSND